MVKDRTTNDEKLRVHNKKYGKKITNSFLPNINSFEKDAKINLKLFRPTTDALKQMTPHEKQDLFTKIKLI
jgi:hypothetical protein